MKRVQYAIIMTGIVAGWGAYAVYDPGCTSIGGGNKPESFGQRTNCALQAIKQGDSVQAYRLMAPVRSALRVSGKATDRSQLDIGNSLRTILIADLGDTAQVDSLIGTYTLMNVYNAAALEYGIDPRTGDPYRIVKGAITYTVDPKLANAIKQLVATKKGGKTIAQRAPATLPKISATVEKPLKVEEFASVMNEVRQKPLQLDDAAFEGRSLSQVEKDAVRYNLELLTPLHEQATSVDALRYIKHVSGPETQPPITSVTAEDIPRLISNLQAHVDLALRSINTRFAQARNETSLPQKRFNYTHAADDARKALADLGEAIKLAEEITDTSIKSNLQAEWKKVEQLFVEATVQENETQRAIDEYDKKPDSEKVVLLAQETVDKHENLVHKKEKLDDEIARLEKVSSTQESANKLDSLEKQRRKLENAIAEGQKEYELAKSRLQASGGYDSAIPLKVGETVESPKRLAVAEDIDKPKIVTIIPEKTVVAPETSEHSTGQPASQPKPAPDGPESAPSSTPTPEKEHGVSPSLAASALRVDAVPSRLPVPPTILVEEEKKKSEEAARAFLESQKKEQQHRLDRLFAKITQEVHTAFSATSSESLEVLLAAKKKALGEQPQEALVAQGSAYTALIASSSIYQDTLAEIEKAIDSAGVAASVDKKKVTDALSALAAWREAYGIAKKHADDRAALLNELEKDIADGVQKALGFAATATDWPQRLQESLAALNSSATRIIDKDRQTAASLKALQEAIMPKFNELEDQKNTERYKKLKTYSEQIAAWLKVYDEKHTQELAALDDQKRKEQKAKDKEAAEKAKKELEAAEKRAQESAFRVATNALIEKVEKECRTIFGFGNGSLDELLQAVDPAKIVLSESNLEAIKALSKEIENYFELFKSPPTLFASMEKTVEKLRKYRQLLDTLYQKCRAENQKRKEEAQKIAQERKKVLDAYTPAAVATRLKALYDVAGKKSSIPAQNALIRIIEAAADGKNYEGSAVIKVALFIIAQEAGNDAAFALLKTFIKPEDSNRTVWLGRETLKPFNEGTARAGQLSVEAYAALWDSLQPFNDVVKKVKSSEKVTQLKLTYWNVTLSRCKEDVYQWVYEGLMESKSVEQIVDMVVKKARDKDTAEYQRQQENQSVSP